MGDANSIAGTREVYLLPKVYNLLNRQTLNEAMKCVEFLRY